MLSEITTKVLYHGTLERNVLSIRKLGLLPQRGSWTSRFSPEASKFVYAVDDQHRRRLVTYITGQISKSNLVEFFDHYRFDDFKRDLIKLGAIVVIETTRFVQYPQNYLTSHRSGPEPGDWYSPEPVSINEIQTIITGHTILEWLQPSKPDFRYRLRDILRRR